MAGCTGKKDAHTCGCLLFKCKKCGNVGCDQGQDDKCSNQAFKGGKCVRCGAIGQKEMFK